MQDSSSDEENCRTRIWFLSETGVSQKSCGLSSVSTSKFPFWGIGIFIPSDHIDAAYNIAYDVLDIILYTYQNNQTIADHITSHHITSSHFIYFISFYSILSHLIIYPILTITLHCVFLKKKQTETPVFRWFLGAELKLRQPIGPEFLAQMVTISPAFSDRHEAGHGLNISENRLYSQ